MSDRCPLGYLFIVVVIPRHNLGNSQVSVNRTIGPTLGFFFMAFENILGYIELGC